MFGAFEHKISATFKCPTCVQPLPPLAPPLSLLTLSTDLHIFTYGSLALKDTGNEHRLIYWPSAARENSIEKCDTRAPSASQHAEEETKST